MNLAGKAVRIHQYGVQNYANDTHDNYDGEI